MAGKRQWRTEKKRSWLAWCLTLILILLLQVDATPKADAEAPEPPDQPHRTPFRPDTRQPLPPGTGFLPPAADLQHINGQQMPRGAVQQVLPNEFDWRDVGGRTYVTPVRDQGTCGACYAFGLLASFESRLLIDEAGTFDLSENHAKECNWRERSNFQYPDPGDYWGSCSGGNTLMVASLLSQTGTVLEAHDPYVARDVACKASPLQKTLLDWRIISTDQVASTQVLKQYLQEYGPLITSMYADRPSFYSYDGSYTVNYSAPAGVTDHSVLIVGWSDNLPPVAGSLQPAQGWIVKNSWGTGWGDEGYFYITYGSANIGSWSSYVDNWQHYDPNGALWFYDDDGWGENWGNSTTAWGLVRFIPDQDTWASRVEFWTSDAATDVDVYLYDDFDGSAPSGLLASKVDLYFTEAGYHSVRLKKPPAVHAGDDVVVVIKFTNTSYPFPIAADPHGPVEHGRTYYSHSGSPGTWVDMGTVYNTDVAIRLRTSTGPAPAPTVTSITPSTATNTGVVQITNLTGAHFQPGANVKLSRSGQPDIPGSDIVVTDETKITGKFDVTGATPGSWDVVITNPDGQSATLTNGFTITEVLNPRVDSIAPSSGTNDGLVHISHLAGAHFQPGADVKLSRSGQPDIPATNVFVASPSQITCDFDLNGAATGAWDVVVTNLDGLSGRLAAGFVIVEPPPPRVYSILPSVGTNDGVIHITNLAGDHFRSGATVQLARTGMDPIWATDVVVVNRSQITCDFDLGGATTGHWDVLVTNPGGRSGSLVDGFVVKSPTAPVVESITPRSAPNTGPVHITNIAGQRFQAGATVKLTKPGQPDIPATNVVVVTGAQITCDLDLTGAAAGNWSVEVANPDGESGTLVRGFLVELPGQTNVLYVPLVRRQWPPVANYTNPERHPTARVGVQIDTKADQAPTVTSITPNSGINDSVVQITDLAGTNFQPGASARLSRFGQPQIAGTDVVVVSETQITCQFDLTDAAPGDWNVRVTNPDGQTGTLLSGFTIATPPAPTVTSITPNSGTNDGVVQITDLAGTNFQPGASARLSRLGQPEIPGTDVVVVSETQITCQFDLTGAAPGTWNVRVTNPDGQTGTLLSGFTIAALPAPTVTSITPNSGTNDGVVQITDLAGSHFQPGASARLSRLGQPEIPGTDVVVVSETQITCQFDLTGAGPGDWNVRVTNPDGQTGTLANGFTVVTSPAPTVTSITPDNGTNDGVVQITNLAGTKFQPDASVMLARSNEPVIPGTGVVVVNTTKITCEFDLTGAAPGVWDVIVTNADTLSGTLPAGFAVTVPPAPQVYSISPSSGTNDESVHISDLAGDHFRPGATVKLTHTDQPPVWATGIVVTPSQITCDFDLDGIATGSWDVVVTNPDGQSGSLAGGFTVRSPTAPVVTSITPRSAPNTGPVHITHLIGQNFQMGAGATLTKPRQTDIPASEVVVVSSTHITCDFDLTDAVDGRWSVEVVNPNGESGTLYKGFRVEIPGPHTAIYLPLTRQTWPRARRQKFYTIADATVSQGYPLVSMGSMIDMWAGYDHCMTPSGEITRSLVRFDLSDLPAGAAISQATLHLRLTNSCDPGGPRTYTVTVYSATEDWSEASVTWDNQPEWGNAYDSVAIPSRTWGYYAFDVTGLVREWVDGSTPNLGLMVRGPEGSGDDSGLLEFVTHEWPGTELDPYLEVSYLGLRSTGGPRPHTASEP